MTGVVEDREGTARYILSGTWDDKMESAKIVDSSKGCSGSEGKQKTVYQTLQPKLLWKKYPLPYAYLALAAPQLSADPRLRLTACLHSALHSTEITQRTCTFSPRWLSL